MKKLRTTLLVIVLLAAGLSTAKAGQPYKMGIGAVVGTMDGASFKLFFTEKLALQADLGIKYGSWTEKGNDWGYSWKYHYNFWTIELNPNLMYESCIKDWSAGGLYWFAGGGLGIGYVIISNWGWGDAGRFGVNAIGGVEWSFNKIPLTLQADVRPGYGLLFFSNDYGDNTHSFFDWATTVSVRYTF